MKSQSVTHFYLQNLNILIMIYMEESLIPFIFGAPVGQRVSDIKVGASPLEDTKRIPYV